MSLALSRPGTDAGIEIKTWNPDFVVINVPQSTNDICIEDFLEACIYVLRNTDLKPDDPRLKFVERISTLKPVDGWGKDRQRLEFEKVEETEQYD